jgi:spectinomycin phosphotransferase
MLEKPAIEDERIIVCLQVEHGLRIVHLAFLPLGGDLGSAVYRVVAEDNTPYFCKLRRRDVFNETIVEVPKFLREQGIAQIIPPLVTKSGKLWAELDVFNLILYPFVEGTNGYDIELSERQWADFGAALKQIHTTTLPLALLHHLRKERYSSEWRDLCMDILQRLEHETFDDPIAVDMAAFLQAKRPLILHAIERAEQLAQEMTSRPLEFVLCHSDIHPGNLFIDKAGTPFIIDWDYPMLAPKERDLMFIGGGQGFKPYVPEQEESSFYRGYQQSQPDPMALTYYRYERGITDIVVESERVLSTTLGSSDRAQSFQYLQWYFLPGGTLEIAARSDNGGAALME